MKKQLRDSIIGIILALIIAILGYFCIHSWNTFGNSARAAIPAEMSVSVGHGATYDIVYIRGHNYAIFYNASGSDIEVIQLD